MKLRHRLVKISLRLGVKTGTRSVRRRAWILQQKNPHILVQLCAHHQVCSQLNRT